MFIIPYYGYLTDNITERPHVEGPKISLEALQAKAYRLLPQYDLLCKAY